jgi:hypothetical protein
MEILLIDIGALAVFLGYMAIVYWHGITHEIQPTTRTADQSNSVVASLENRALHAHGK